MYPSPINRNPDRYHQPGKYLDESRRLRRLTDRPRCIVVVGNFFTYGGTDGSEKSGSMFNPYDQFYDYIDGSYDEALAQDWANFDLDRLDENGFDLYPRSRDFINEVRYLRALRILQGALKEGKLLLWSTTLGKYIIPSSVDVVTTTDIIFTLPSGRSLSVDVNSICKDWVVGIGIPDQLRDCLDMLSRWGWAVSYNEEGFITVSTGASSGIIVIGYDETIAQEALEDFDNLPPTFTFIGNGETLFVYKYNSSLEDVITKRPTPRGYVVYSTGDSFTFPCDLFISPDESRIIDGFDSKSGNPLISEIDPEALEQIFQVW
jgi:hypothetical protein